MTHEQTAQAPDVLPENLAPQSERTATTDAAAKAMESKRATPLLEVDRRVLSVTAEGFAGGWPKELPRDILESVDLDKLLARLVDYLKRDYRGIPAGAKAEGITARPEYEVVEGKVGRAANPVQDMKLVQTARWLKDQGVPTQHVADSANPFELWGRMAVNVIEHYAQTPLAKFLFLLPTVLRSEEAIALGKTAIVVTERLRIDVYRGVENVLLEIWDELGEGESFDDASVTRKLLSIVESAKA